MSGSIRESTEFFEIPVLAVCTVPEDGVTVNEGVPDGQQGVDVVVLEAPSSIEPTGAGDEHPANARGRTVNRDQWNGTVVLGCARVTGIEVVRGGFGPGGDHRGIRKRRAVGGALAGGRVKPDRARGRLGGRFAGGSLEGGPADRRGGREEPASVHEHSVRGSR